MRRRAKSDSNQGDIVLALRQVGAFVRDMSAVGDGWPDLCVLFRGAVHLLEVKADGAAVKRKSSTAQRQQEIRDRARECGVHIYVVTSEEEALRAIGAMA